LESEIKDAFTLADGFKADPAKAIDLLRQVEAKVAADTNMTQSQRNDWLAKVRNRIRGFESAAKGGNDQQPTTAPGNAAPPRNDDEKEAAIHRELNVIRVLRQQGRLAEATAKAEELARNYPNHPALQPAAQQSSRTSSTADLVLENERLSREKVSGMTSAMRSVDKSAVATTGGSDIVYDPKIWEKVSKRVAIDAEKMSTKEKFLVNLLSQITREDFTANNLPFDQVLKMLEKEVGQPLVVTKSTLDDMKISYEMTINSNIPRGISKRALLRMVLGELGLTYIVKNEVIQVVSVLEAQREMKTKILYIRDLIAMSPAGSTPEQLADFLQDTVDPSSWKKHGGPGTIVYNEGMKAFVIRNTAEVISALGGGTRSH